MLCYLALQTIYHISLLRLQISVNEPQDKDIKRSFMVYVRDVFAIGLMGADRGLGSICIGDEDLEVCYMNYKQKH